MALNSELKSRRVATGLAHPIATDLRLLRTSRGLTQAQVAKLLGVPVSTFAAWENGQNGPSWAGLVEWSAALGMRLIHGFLPVGGVE